MSDTPRTDAKQFDVHEVFSGVTEWFVEAKFARKLERERRALRARAEKAEAALDSLRAEVARLHEDNRKLRDVWRTVGRRNLPA